MNPELLAPAGNLEKLKVAVLYGADAVYLGGRLFGLRAGAGNFNQEEMAEGVRFAHGRGARVYVTINIFAHNQDLKSLPEYLDSIRAAGIDGAIISDPGIINMVKRLHPDLPIHLSTQANTTNRAAASFWEEQGVSRVVLARELSLEEIREIRKSVKVELEIFIHGAMCISYSGRCLLSSYLTGRNANRGDCSQPCRWRYAIVEEKRPGEFYPIEEDERGTYILGSRDLCLIEHIPALVEAGINSFKIEGRMKSVNYVAGVVKAYRQALDSYLKDRSNYHFNPAWLRDISMVSNRRFTTGFLFGHPGAGGQHYEGEIYVRSHTFVGLVKDYDPVNGMSLIEQRNKFTLGDRIQIMVPEGEGFSQTINKIFNEEGNEIKEAPHPQQLVRVPLERQVPPYSIIRKV